MLDSITHILPKKNRCHILLNKYISIFFGKVTINNLKIFR